MCSLLAGLYYCSLNCYLEYFIVPDLLYKQVSPSKGTREKGKQVRKGPQSAERRFLPAIDHKGPVPTLIKGTFVQKGTSNAERTFKQGPLKGLPISIKISVTERSPAEIKMQVVPPVSNGAQQQAGVVFYSPMRCAVWRCSEIRHPCVFRHGKIAQ